MDSDVKYILSLQAIRDRSRLVWAAARTGRLSHFDVHLDQLEAVATYVAGVIQRDFGPDKFDTIPPHGRWQHFEVGGIPRVTHLIQNWEGAGVDKVEICRRLIDLFFVSVLLDAGAGDFWRYVEPDTGNKYERSEGIAVASLYMFQDLAFTSGATLGADGAGLVGLTGDKLSTGFQISEENPMLGVSSRAALLRSLGRSLQANPQVFGEEGRPGKIVDYMLQSAGDASELDIIVLWESLQAALIPSWPTDRTTVNGLPVGDAWPLSTLASVPEDSGPAPNIQPFHKLTQWLTYSLMVPFQRILGKTWKNEDSLTGLPEYRNGGLFVDLGVLTLKPETLQRGLQASGSDLPQFEGSDDVIVEWRALTVRLLDELYPMINTLLPIKLSMAQILEAGTWKSGREIAATKRPDTKSSPIVLISDGTLF